MPKFKVCLTGGIASGKTYVSNQLSALGACVIDADVLARQVVKRGSIGLAQLVDAFGEEVLNSNKTLNRGKLKELVFKQKAQLQKLNSILHPLIRSAFAKASELNQSKLEVWVIPLFSKQEGYERFDRVLVVDVIESIQLKRITERDQISVEMAKTIIGSQPSRALRLSMSTDVIANNKGFDRLDNSIRKISDLYNLMKIGQTV